MIRIVAVLIAALVVTGSSRSSAQDIKLQPVLPSGTIQMPEGLDDYPRLTVESKVTSSVLEITGRIPKARRTDISSVKNPATCHDGSSECRLVAVGFPAGMVVADFKPVYEVRAPGGTWVELKQERKTIVLDANRMFHETGARPGEYEEFRGFSAKITFGTVNCAVQNGNRLRWTLMNWNAHDVEFRIRIKLRRCGNVVEEEDESS